MIEPVRGDATEYGSKMSVNRSGYYRYMFIGHHPNRLHTRDFHRIRIVAQVIGEISHARSVFFGPIFANNREGRTAVLPKARHFRRLGLFPLSILTVILKDIHRKDPFELFFFEEIIEGTLPCLIFIQRTKHNK